MNQKWRTEIAHVPYLSEFDMQAMGRANASLTFYRQGNDWRQFPAGLVFARGAGNGQAGL